MKSNSAYLLVTCLCSLILRYGFCFATPNGVSSTLQRNLERTTANPSNNQLYMIANNIPTSGRILLKNERNGLLNRLSFSWVDKIMKIGNKKSLDIQDLWELEANDLMSNASERFHKRLYNETLIRDNNKPLVQQKLHKKNILQFFWSTPLIKSILKMYYKQFLCSGILKFANTVIQFLPALIITRILKLVETSSIPTSTHLLFNKHIILSKYGLFLTLSLFIALCMKTIVENQYFDVIINTSGNIRGVLSAAIFQKSLRLSPESRQNVTAGEIVNYMQLDTSRMEAVANTIHIAWDGLLQVTGFTILLLRFLGPAVLAGIGAMIVMIPLQAMFLKK